MKRLDKFLTELNIGSRSEVKSYIQKGYVTVDGVVVKKPETKVLEESIVTFKGEVLNYEEFSYFMLNKPAGVVSATTDHYDKTVIDFFKDEPCKNLFPVGRLDKDTEGLLLITNDGALGHRLTSPRHHVEKTYYVKLQNCIKKEHVCMLEDGVDIGEKKPTQPSKVEIISDDEVYITITEGKFHQVKRMFEVVSNKVVYLKRMSMGTLKLDENLELGAYRKLTEDEISSLLTLERT